MSTYYVSPTGNDANIGSLAQPFATLQKAGNIVVAGDTVYALPGTYNSVSIINLNTSGTQNARIQYISFVSRLALLRSTGVSHTLFNTGDYVDIIGFDVSGDGRIGIRNQGKYGTIQGNRVHDYPCSNVGATGGAGILQNFLDANNPVGNDTFNNEVFNIGYRTDSPALVQGIYISSPSGRVFNNKVYGCSGWGIQCWHAANTETISNNLVYNNGTGGIVVGAGDTPGGVTCDNCVISNNIVRDNPIGIHETGATGLNNVYLNNCLYNNPVSITLQHGLIDTGTINSDPQFVNYRSNGIGDYHLLSSSPCRGTGIGTGAISPDYDGNPRPTPNQIFDIGPYQYIGANLAPFQSASGGIHMSPNNWNSIGVFQPYIYNIGNASASYAQASTRVAQIASKYAGVWAARIDQANLWSHFNPAMDVAYYQPSFVDQGPQLWPTPDSFATWLAAHPDWIMYILNTTQIEANTAKPFVQPNIPLDFTNPAVITNFVQKYASQLNKAQANTGTPANYQAIGSPNVVNADSVPQYTALALDNCNLNNTELARYKYSGGGFVNLGVAGAWTGAANDINYAKDVVTYLGLLRTQLQALPTPLKLIVNLDPGNVSLTDPVMATLMLNVDGIWYEKGFTGYGLLAIPTDATFNGVMNWFLNYWIANDKIIWLQHTFRFGGGPAEREAGLAIYLLIKSPLTSLAMTPLNAAGTSADYGSEYWYTTEYATPIGYPVETANISQTVWKRQYSNGLVLYNHNSATNPVYKLPQGRSYKDNYGNQFSDNIQLYTSSGKVLLNA